jgi:hypothetical protein
MFPPEGPGINDTRRRNPYLEAFHWPRVVTAAQSQWYKDINKSKEQDSTNICSAPNNALGPLTPPVCLNKPQISS